MQTSEEQFQELMAHFVARGNKALAQGTTVPPISLVLGKDGDVRCSVGIADTSGELEQVLAAMKKSLVEQVRTGAVLATCVASTDAETGNIIALLENYENYCAKVTIPVVTGSGLDMENMQIDDGHICVFPLASDS